MSKTRAQPGKAMQQEITAARRAKAVYELREHENRTDAIQVVDHLDSGLTLLAELLYVRLHEDVEKMLGLDSMLAPYRRPRPSRWPLRKSIYT